MCLKPVNHFISFTRVCLCECNWDTFILFLNWRKEGREFRYFGKDKPVDETKKEISWMCMAVCRSSPTHPLIRKMFVLWMAQNSVFLKSVWTTIYQHRRGQNLDIQILYFPPSNSFFSPAYRGYDLRSYSIGRHVFLSGNLSVLSGVTALSLTRVTINTIYFISECS